MLSNVSSISASSTTYIATLLYNPPPRPYPIESAKVGPILMQLMIFPRCAFTSMDSIYCAKFLLLLHRIKLPNFYSLICFDKVNPSDASTSGSGSSSSDGTSVGTSTSGSVVQLLLVLWLANHYIVV